MPQPSDQQYPPAPPPRPSSHVNSGRATPAPLSYASALESGPEHRPRELDGGAAATSRYAPPSDPIPDPGDQWIPDSLRTKLEVYSSRDIADLLASTSALNALAHGSEMAHPSLKASRDVVDRTLTETEAAAARLIELEARAVDQRAALQAQLLATRALERQWHQKQAEMDDALAPFSPIALYQRLSQAIQEQDQICDAIQESFLSDHGAGGLATEREILEWTRRYREAKVLSYVRQERRNRWDEGRVGGWR